MHDLSVSLVTKWTDGWVDNAIFAEPDQYIFLPFKFIANLGSLPHLFWQFTATHVIVPRGHWSSKAAIRSWIQITVCASKTLFPQHSTTLLTRYEWGGSEEGKDFRKPSYLYTFKTVRKFPTVPYLDLTPMNDELSTQQVSFPLKQILGFHWTSHPVSLNLNLFLFL